MYHMMRGKPIMRPSAPKEPPNSISSDEPSVALTTGVSWARSGALSVGADDSRFRDLTLIGKISRSRLRQRELKNVIWISASLVEEGNPGTSSYNQVSESHVPNRKSHYFALICLHAVVAAKWSEEPWGVAEESWKASQSPSRIQRLAIHSEPILSL